MTVGEGMVSSMRVSRLQFVTGFLLCICLLASCGGGGGGGGGSDGRGVRSGTASKLIREFPEPSPPAALQVQSPFAAAAGLLDCGPSSGGISGNRLNASAENYLLCRHNESRSRVALGLYLGVSGLLPAAGDMKKLQWDDKLEQVAQNYANRCQWRHNPDRQAQYNALSPTDIGGEPVNGTVSVGENLAFQSSTALTAARFSYAVNGYEAWEDEGQYYSFGALNVNDYCSEPPCGHFTQVIWADTYKVGCAVNFCPADTVHRYPATLLVCNYAASGNYVNRQPY